ncbi:TPA: morphogenetic protein [Serratia marcescens]|nr:morphogenetic protein [Serratia marcescens]HAT4973121.1 morphogenetic protein [Serratia marcescens]HAT4987315.1 morphogenetic protein [Serratia marcescens]HAT5047125.1 morphogenetic protein [Serratia marcescens]HEJ7078219.1 morphogenetic protein [Serratia marcescens]
MKEHPVIFNGEMVRAILDGRKTQTRRVIKNQRMGDSWSVKPAESPRYERHSHDWWLPTGTKPYSALPVCPFGQVGDRLWVREAYQGPLFNFDQMETYLEDTSKFERPEFCEYRADGGRTPEYYDADDNLRHGWKPSIHMPRWASRILLEITAVRVERLNDISDGDAIREGCSAADMKSGDCVADVFARLWSSIYGVDSWNANPWVWVIEFRRVEGGKVNPSEIDDRLYSEAVEFARLHASIGIVAIQRHFSIGFNRAAWLIERMQEEGVVTAPAWNGIRTVIHGGSDASK